MSELLARAREAARAKRFDEAADLLVQILDRDPNHLPALDLAGFVSFFRGDPEGAEGYCRRALEISPDHAYAWSGLGSSLSRQGRVDEALPCFDRASELRPDWFEPVYDKAVALDRAGRHAAALELLEGARERFADKTKRIDGLSTRIRSKLE